MPIDRHYLLFVHGVNTRERREQPTYADYLFELIANKVRMARPTCELQKIAFYWGDVGEKDEAEMLEEVKASPIYSHFFLKNLRETQIQQFVGDAALYISQTCGARVLNRIYEQAQVAFENFNPNVTNHVHLITHSWGTVILLDALFAARWDPDTAPAYSMVQEIRRIMFGVEPASKTGLFVRSIHTMGSPLAIFSLLEKVAVATPPAKAAKSVIATNQLFTVAEPIVAGEPVRAGRNVAPAPPPTIQGKTHDITDRLSQFLDALYAQTKTPLPWNNFAHPGDLVAYPLSILLPNMLDSSKDRIAVTDFLVQDSGPHFFENIDPVAVIRAGDAHGSYWRSNSVAEEIARSILAVR